MTPIRTAWHHIRRSPFQSMVATMIMTITFFVLAAFVLISQGMSSVLLFFETKPEITIFLKDGLDRNTVESLQKELSNYSNIREIKFISKEKALSLYKEQNKDNPYLTEMVTSSILPASFEVSVTDPKVLEQIALNFSAKKDQVDEIIYQKDIIDSILNWTAIIRQIGIISIIVSAVISFLIIFVLIGMKITNRKDEVHISRLLGATSFYVVKPFIIEGVIYGLTGGIIGSLTAIGAAIYFSPSVNAFFNPIVFFSQDIGLFLNIVLACLGLGMMLGYCASLIGARRYIKF